MAYSKKDWIHDRLREKSFSNGEFPDIKMAADEGDAERGFQEELIRRTGMWKLLGVWVERSKELVPEDTESGRPQVYETAAPEGKAFDHRYLPVDEEELPFFSPLLNERGKEIISSGEDLLTLGAVNEEGVAAGILILKLHNEGFGEIRYLYTAESERNTGLMEGLIKYISPLLLRAGFRKLYFIIAKDRAGVGDKDIEELFKSLGAKITVVTEHIVSVPAREILKKSGKNTGKCLPLRSVPTYLIREVVEDADEDVVDRLYYFIDDKNGDNKEAFDSASTVIVKDEIIKDCLFYVPREYRSGIILVYMRGQDPLSLAEMLAFSARSAIRQYGEDAYVTFATINGIGKAMAGLFKDDYEWVRAERADILLDAMP